MTRQQNYSNQLSTKFVFNACCKKNIDGHADIKVAPEPKSWHIRSLYFFCRDVPYFFYVSHLGNITDK